MATVNLRHLYLNKIMKKKKDKKVFKALFVIFVNTDKDLLVQQFHINGRSKSTQY